MTPGNAARHPAKSKGIIMSERKVPVTLPTGARAEGVEVQVDESTERWSEFKLQDGTILRVTVTVLSAVRVDGEYDPAGNPLYVANMSPVITVASAPDKFRKPVQ
jgi:hypothetical protein